MIQRTLLLLAILIAPACASLEPVMVEFHQEARREMSVRTPNIAVVPGKAETAEAREVLDLVTAGIERVLITDKVWKVVDVETADKRIEIIEKALTESVAFDDEDLLQLGHALNVSLLLIPDIHAKVTTRQETQQRTMRLGTGQWEMIDVNGTKVPVEKSRQVLVSDVWEARTLVISGRVRVIEVETGEVVTTVEVPGVSRTSRILVTDGARSLWDSAWQWCALATGLKEDPPRVHPSLAEEAENFLSAVVTRAVNEIAAVTIRVDSVLFETGDLGPGVRLARAARWRQAADFWERRLADDPSDSGCLHNLGLAYVALGDLDQAANFLSEAVALEGDEHTTALLLQIDALRAQAEAAAP